MERFEMEKFEKGGTKFTIFKSDGKRYLCTGEVTGRILFDFVGEVFDCYIVEGASSVVRGDENISIDELYEKWLDNTGFYREVLGIKY